MARILKLSDGRCSLEYDYKEIDAIRSALAEIDPFFSYERRPGSALVTASGTHLVADTDAMGLSLISSDDAGDVLLRRIAEMLRNNSGKRE